MQQGIAYGLYPNVQYVWDFSSSVGSQVFGLIEIVGVTSQQQVGTGMQRGVPPVGLSTILDVQAGAQGVSQVLQNVVASVVVRAGCGLPHNDFRSNS